LLSDEALGWIMLSFCNLRIGDMQAILECDNLLERQQTILSVVQTEMESFAVEDDVAAKVGKIWYRIESNDVSAMGM
jgi:hypothetical protein